MKKPNKIEWNKAVRDYCNEKNLNRKYTETFADFINRKFRRTK